MQVTGTQCESLPLPAKLLQFMQVVEVDFQNDVLIIQVNKNHMRIPKGMARTSSCGSGTPLSSGILSPQ